MHGDIQTLSLSELQLNANRVNEFIYVVRLMNCAMRNADGETIEATTTLEFPQPIYGFCFQNILKWTRAKYR